MTDEQIVAAIRGAIKEELQPINERLDRMDERLDKIESDIEQIKEDTEITRDVTNSIVEWIDVYWRDDRPFPVEEKEAI